MFRQEHKKALPVIFTLWYNVNHCPKKTNNVLAISLNNNIKSYYNQELDTKKLSSNLNLDSNPNITVGFFPCTLSTVVCYSSALYNYISLQGLFQLLETSVTIRCRQQDLAIVKVLVVKISLISHINHKILFGCGSITLYNNIWKRFQSMVCVLKIQFSSLMHIHMYIHVLCFF